MASAAASVASTRPYAVPRNGGGARAIALAVVMHLLLGGLLFFGIRWQSSPPAVIQAELWSATPQTAAPPPRPVPPPPKVEAPTPAPAPKVVAQPEPEPPKVKVDIAEKAAPPKKKEPPKVEPPKVEPIKVEAPKPEPKPQPKPEPKVVPKPVPPKVEAKPSPRAELLKLQQQAAVEAPQRPPSELNSLLAAAGAESSTGRDQQTSGPRGDQNGYTAKLQAAIRSQMRYPASATNNPFVKVRIEQLPNGEVINVTVTKASGVPAFDDAVERAIRAASPLPRPTQGQPPRELDLTYNMYDKS